LSNAITPMMTMRTRTKIRHANMSGDSPEQPVANLLVLDRPKRLLISRCLDLPTDIHIMPSPSLRLCSSRRWIARPVLSSAKHPPATTCDDPLVQPAAAQLQYFQTPFPRGESQCERSISASCPLFKIQSAIATSRTLATDSQIHAVRNVSSILAAVLAYLVDLDDKLRFFVLPQGHSWVADTRTLMPPTTIITMTMNAKNPSSLLLDLHTAPAEPSHASLWTPLSRKKTQSTIPHARLCQAMRMSRPSIITTSRPTPSCPLVSRLL
jgi:hypothetical protein